MVKQSAGILVYRVRDGAVEVLLAHPGGPYFAKKDLGVWSIPKGEYEDEEPLTAARREFREEMGADIDGKFIALGQIKQKGGKTVHAWAVEAEFDVGAVVSNTFMMEWPPRSGKMNAFPEVDRAQWCSIADAREKINPAQAEFIDRLLAATTG